jgi:hypothetical protein
MSAKFITAILTAGALVATLSAAPAKAGNEDLKRFIGAPAGLYILGQALENSQVQEVHDRRHGGHHRQWNHHRAPRYYGHHRKGHGKKWHRPPLPRYCLRRVGGRHQSWLAFSSYCLKRNYPAALPRACRDRAWYKGKSRPVYGIRCLKHRGYRLAGR